VPQALYLLGNCRYEMGQAEQAMVRNALDQCGGNIQKTADLLGLSRAALYRRLEKYGITA
jgi:transcriptional regulator of acetoin/glycerol metabolism